MRGIFDDVPTDKIKDLEDDVKQITKEHHKSKKIIKDLKVQIENLEDEKEDIEKRSNKDIRRLQKAIKDLEECNVERDQFERLWKESQRKIKENETTINELTEYIADLHIVATEKTNTPIVNKTEKKDENKKEDEIKKIKVIHAEEIRKLKDQLKNTKDIMEKKDLALTTMRTKLKECIDNGHKVEIQRLKEKYES